MIFLGFSGSGMQIEGGQNTVSTHPLLIFIRIDNQTERERERERFLKSEKAKSH